MKRVVGLMMFVLVVALLLWWLIPWISNGGWPSSGPAGGHMPVNVTQVTPSDGAVLEKSFGYCVHFDYLNGNGIGEEARRTVRYYLDGRNVSKNMVDLIDLEYPTQIGEFCYRPESPLKLGWHTAKVTFEDNSGEKVAYLWRFQVAGE